MENKVGWVWFGTALMFIGFTTHLSVIFGSEHDLGYLQGLFGINIGGFFYLLGSIFPFWIFFFAIYLWLKAGEKQSLRDAERQQKSALESEKENQDKVTSIVSMMRINPEIPIEELRQNDTAATKEQIKIAAETLFRERIDAKNFSAASQLLAYHAVDQHDLLPVMIALGEFDNRDTVNLKPQTYKITLDPGETAYEKLPCNWQKIHTYLAPLTDELEQSDILDTGNIYITDQRVFFVGKKGSETVSLSDIAYMDLKDDALQFFRDEGLSEIFAFPTAHHAKYAELVIKELMGR